MSEQSDEPEANTTGTTATAAAGNSSQQSTNAPNVRGGPSNGATRLNNNSYSNSDSDINSQSCQC